MSGDKPMKPTRLKGFRDYLPDLMEARQLLLQRTIAKAHLAGFRPIATPTLEYAETLMGQGSEETDKQVYHFRDQGDRHVGLRFDLTLPMARMIAEHQGQLTFPLKTLHYGQVFRGEKPQKGRYREFAQCDLDILGIDSLMADVEILASLASIIESFELGGFRMAIGNRNLLAGMLRRCGVAPGVGETKALIALDKLDKIGPDKVAALLAEIDGFDGGQADALLERLTTKGDDGQTDVAAAREFAIAADGDEEALAEWDRYAKTLSLLRGISDAFVADLSIARGLGYYTGVVFETTLVEMPQIGSVSSGGRYNNLVSRFSTRSLPGVGGSVGIDRIVGAMEEMPDRLPPRQTPIFIATIGDEGFAYGVGLAQRLRDQGLVVDIGLSPKVKKQFQRADRNGAPVVITVGENEAKTQTVALKVMATGEETRDVPAAELPARLAVLLT